MGEKESRVALLGKSSPCNLSPLESAVSELLRVRQREWEVFPKGKIKIEPRFSRERLYFMGGAMGKK